MQQVKRSEFWRAGGDGDPGASGSVGGVVVVQSHP